MKKELFLDISSEETGGSLMRIVASDGKASFLHQHSTFDADRDEIRVFETPYPSFDAFWKQLTTNREWFYLHPLFVHPEIRAFIKSELKNVNWTVQGDEKWQLSHRRQWDKVLSDPGNYYKPF